MPHHTSLALLIILEYAKLLLLGILAVLACALIQLCILFWIGVFSIQWRILDATAATLQMSAEDSPLSIAANESSSSDACEMPNSVDHCNLTGTRHILPLSDHWTLQTQSGDPEAESSGAPKSPSELEENCEVLKTVSGSMSDKSNDEWVAQEANSTPEAKHAEPTTPQKSEPQQSPIANGSKSEQSSLRSLFSGENLGSSQESTGSSNDTIRVSNGRLSGDRETGIRDLTKSSILEPRESLRRWNAFAQERADLKPFEGEGGFPRSEAEINHTWKTQQRTGNPAHFVQQPAYRFDPQAQAFFVLEPAYSFVPRGPAYFAPRGPAHFIPQRPAHFAPQRPAHLSVGKALQVFDQAQKEVFAQQGASEEASSENESKPHEVVGPFSAPDAVSETTDEPNSKSSSSSANYNSRHESVATSPSEQMDSFKCGRCQNTVTGESPKKGKWHDFLCLPCWTVDARIDAAKRVIREGLFGTYPTFSLPKTHSSRFARAPTKPIQADRLEAHKSSTSVGKLNASNVSQEQQQIMQYGLEQTVTTHQTGSGDNQEDTRPGPLSSGYQHPDLVGLDFTFSEPTEMPQRSHTKTRLVASAPEFVMPAPKPDLALDPKASEY